MIDTHAHLAYPQLSENLDHFLHQAQQAGVEGIVTVGTTAEDSHRCVELAERYPLLRAAVGIHPNHAHEASIHDWQRIESLAANPKVVAIGETGLDRYWDDCPWQIQLRSLERHLLLARQVDLPLVIHTRDCMEEAVQWLTDQNRTASFRAVMHSFTGNTEQAEKCLEAGFFISFAGMITFKNSAELRKVAKQVSLDRILVETDSPYLTPHPFRGQRPNHPALVRHTLECIAELHGVSAQEMSQIATRNAKAAFSRWE